MIHIITLYNNIIYNTFDMHLIRFRNYNALKDVQLIHVILVNYLSENTILYIKISILSP